MADPIRAAAASPAPPPARVARPAALAILGLAAALLLLDPPGADLFEPDETRYAEISRAMVADGDWLHPRLNGTAYWEKPPLTHWLGAASRAAFGEGTWPARLPARAAALAVLAMLVAGWGGRDPLSVRLWAGVAWLAAPLSFALGRTLLTDGVLAACTTGAFLAIRAIVARGGEEEDSAPAPRGAACALGACVGLGVLAKGLVAAALPGLALLLWAAVLGRWRAVLRVTISPAPLVAVAVAAPAFLLVEGAAPGFNRHFWIDEHLLRYVDDGKERVRPFWYLPAALAAGLLPWTAHLVAAAGRPRLPRRDELRARPDDVFLWAWLAAPLLFFAPSRSKLVPYVLPAVPAACLLAARVVAEGGPRARRAAVAAAVVGAMVGVALLAAAGHARVVEEGMHGAARAMGAAALAGAAAVVLAAARAPRALPHALALGAVGLAAAATLHLPAVAAARPFAAFAARMDEEARRHGAEPATFRCHANAIPLRLGRPVTVVAHTDEMATDGVFPPRLFPRAREFWARWHAGERLVVMLRDQDRALFMARAGDGVARVLDDRGGHLLVANYPAGAR